MSNESPSHRRTRFRDLNWLGKSVFLGGTVMRLTANLIDRTADRVSSIAAESKKAYKREMDPNIEDARIIEEVSEADPTSDA